MATRFLFFLSAVFSCTQVFGQAAMPIQLMNPSFEDYPKAERVPIGWKDCGFPGESPPDTHPSGSFEVVKKSSHGNTYLGMVVRDNDTWERVSQRLQSPIIGGQCYSFNLNLCRSELYVSFSRLRDGAVANYVKPAKLIIWAGDAYCNKKERLAESPLISNTEWQSYSFKFEPKQNHSYIVLEAFYKTPVLFPYNGNVLVDNASDIIPIACDEEPELAEMPEVNFTNPSGRSVRVYDPNYTIQASVKNIHKKSALSLKINDRVSDAFTFDPASGILKADIHQFKEGMNKIVLQAENNAGKTEDRAILIYEPPTVAAAPIPQPDNYEAPAPPRESTSSVAKTETPKKHKKIEGYAKEELRKGQVIKLRALSFKMNDSTLNAAAHVQLDKIYEFLKENPAIAIEIGGHTNGRCDAQYCNQLSTARAKAVADYLKEKGVSTTQLTYKGYGKTRPIASNNTPHGRKKNQRVEIKILSTG